MEHKFSTKKLETKGFDLNATLSPINQISPFIHRGMNPTDLEWVPVFQGGFDSISQFSYFEKTLQYMLENFNFKFCIVSTFQLKPEIEEAYERSDLKSYIKKTETRDPGKLNAPWAPNFLRQIHNTHEGLRYAQELGFQRAIKIRIDQRFQNVDALVGISWIIDEFPSFSEKTKGRVVGSSFNTFKTLPLFLSDCLMFGYTSDLISYWTPVDREKIPNLATQMSERTGLDPKLFRHPEVWLAARYLLLNYPEKHYSAKESNVKFWSDLAMIVDATAIKHNWQKQPNALKTNYKSTKWFEKSLDERFGEMTFWDWVTLFGSASRNRRA